MCDDCGCGDTEKVPLKLEVKLLSANTARAQELRRRFTQAGVLALDLMGSPGSGKTRLLEATAQALGGTRRIIALSGDLATDHDGARLRAAGIVGRTITTGTACHLDARQVERALEPLDWQGADLLVIENVGNLVCPALYDLGQAAKIVALSVTEGEDKPEKYPVIFREADLVLLTKTDLLPHLPGFSVEAFARSLSRVMPTPRWLPGSAQTGEGMPAWLDWIAATRAATLPIGRALGTA